jgi:hypothetical protein
MKITNMTLIAQFFNKSACASRPVRKLSDDTIFLQDDDPDTADHDSSDDVVNSKDESLQLLNDDLIVCVATFLSARDVRAFSQTNARHRRIVARDACAYLWRHSWFQQAFGCSLDASTTVIETGAWHPFCIVSLAVANRPTHMIAATTTRDCCIRDKTTIQFVGAVGHGDRSVRANAPFPRISPFCTKKWWASINRTRPFCLPFYSSDSILDVRPRLISYFEVSILESKQSLFEVRQHEHRQFPVRTTRPSCVAVGLATRQFRCASRMPGWDPHSYGYHGDDGGVFHGSGAALRTYGPTFGAGDVVGCGMDHVRSAIFYTLNGVSLGPAVPIKDEQGLFPVVGVDTHSVVQCNFVGPFVFDLSALLKEQESMVIAYWKKQV